ncbi:MAG: hypothetical protein WDM85_01395 [Caulobacteraceae bacterium]
MIAFNTHETPTRGREMTVLEQLIGSIGGRLGAAARSGRHPPAATRDDRH